jgi:hypothetical protein
LLFYPGPLRGTLHVSMLELCFQRVHLLQRLLKHDVEAGSAIHEALGEVIAINPRVDDQGVVLLRIQLRVVCAIPSDWLFLPLDVLRDFWHYGIEGTQGGFPCLG